MDMAHRVRACFNAFQIFFKEQCLVHKLASRYIAGTNYFQPLFPQAVEGQFEAVSPDKHAPFQSWPPSEPDH